MLLSLSSMFLLLVVLQHLVSGDLSKRELVLSQEEQLRWQGGKQINREGLTNVIVRTAKARRGPPAPAWWALFPLTLPLYSREFASHEVSECQDTFQIHTFWISEVLFKRNFSRCPHAHRFIELQERRQSTVQSRAACIFSPAQSSPKHSR